MANRRHFVPVEVRTRKKISAKIYLFDFFFLIGALVVALATQNLVIPSLRIIYIGFTLLVALYLTRNSGNNPGKHVFQAMWFYIRRPRTSYIPVETEKKEVKIRGRG